MTSTAPAPSPQIFQRAKALVESGQKVIDTGTPEECRDAYEERVIEFQELIGLASRADTDFIIACYGSLYFLAWRGCQEIATLAPFAEQVSKPFGAFIKTHWDCADRDSLIKARKDRQAQSIQPMKVAYVTGSAQLEGANAIARVTSALISGHIKASAPPIEIVVYFLTKPNQAFINTVTSPSIILADASSLQSPMKRAETIVQDARNRGIDVLIADNPGPVETMIFQKRAAPLQAYAEMGFAPWGISELDLCFRGISKDASLLEACCQKIIPSKRPSLRHIVDQRFNPVDVAAVRQKVLDLKPASIEPSDVVIYGNYGRLAKISTIFLERVEQILLQQERALFFLGGTGNTEVIDAFLARSPVRNRILFTPTFVSGYLVSSILDVFLDSDPFPGGISCVECQIKSVPVIWRSDFATDSVGLIDDMRDPNLSADNDEDYVAKALMLADNDIRADASKRAFQIAEMACDNVGAAREIEEALHAELSAL